LCIVEDAPSTRYRRGLPRQARSRDPSTVRLVRCPANACFIRDGRAAAGPGARRHPTWTCTSSWLNLVERWFAELANRKLRRSTHRSVAALEADVTAAP